MTDKLRCRDGSITPRRTQDSEQIAAGLVRPLLLIEAAAYLRENVVGIGTDQSDRAHDEHKDDSQHDSILRDVLALFFIP